MGFWWFLCGGVAIAKLFRTKINQRFGLCFWLCHGRVPFSSSGSCHGKPWLGRDVASRYKRCSESRSLIHAAHTLCAKSVRNLSAVSAFREETEVFLLQAAQVTAAMLGIDATQLRAAPDFQTQAGTDCLAAQQRGLGGCRGQRRYGRRHVHM